MKRAVIEIIRIMGTLQPDLVILVVLALMIWGAHETR